MFRKFILSAAMLCVLTVIRAQTTLTLSFGPSFPVGNFGSDEVRSSSSGLANTGVFIGIGYTHPLSKYVSLAAIVRGQQNALNTAALENTFSNTNISNGPVFSDGTQPPPPPSSTIYRNWQFEKDHWRTGSLLLGAQVQFPRKGFSFIAKAMLGPSYVSAPEVKGESFSDTATASMVQSGAHAWGLGYLIGGGVRYDVSRRFFVIGSLELFGTNKIKFEDITATITTTRGNPSNPLGYSVQQMTVTGEGKQTISTVNVSAGIGIRL